MLVYGAHKICPEELLYLQSAAYVFYSIFSLAYSMKHINIPVCNVYLVSKFQNVPLKWPSQQDNT